MRLSVLVASRNRSAPLLRCLESVAKQSSKPHEIVVLDDASDQLRVADLLAESKVRDVRVVRSETPLGVAAGRNRLFREATGDAFFVLDDDAYLERDDSLARLRDVLTENPRAGIVAVRIIDHRYASPRSLVPLPKHALRQTPGLVDRPQRVAYFLGGGHGIRRELYERIGGYHDDFVFGEEELDLSYRAIQAGFEIFYTPSIIVRHHPMPSVLGAAGRRESELFYHVRNRLVLAKRYLPAPQVLSYLAIWLCRYALVAVRQGKLPEFARGVASGLRILKHHARRPLQHEALAYVREHHGRLWI